MTRALETEVKTLKMTMEKYSFLSINFFISTVQVLFKDFDHRKIILKTATTVTRVNCNKRYHSSHIFLSYSIQDSLLKMYENILLR